MRGWQVYCFWAAMVFLLLLTFVEFHAKMSRKDLLEYRVEKLERQMLEKTRPVIHADYATIYNSDGDIAIETIGEKENSTDE